MTGIRASALLAVALGAGALSGIAFASQATSREPAQLACSEGSRYGETRAEGRLVAAWCARLDGTKHGPHVAYYSNGAKLAERVFTDGVVDGPATYYLNDGTVHLEEVWRHGEVISEWRNPVVDTLSQERLRELGSAECAGVKAIACAPGDRRPECRRARSKQPPVRTVRFPNGRKQAEGHVVEGERFGLWRSWHRNGRLAREVNYHNGELAWSYREWHENGRPKTAGEYLSGRKSGRWQHWDEAGRALPDEVFPTVPAAR